MLRSEFIDNHGLHRYSNIAKCVFAQWKRLAREPRVVALYPYFTGEDLAAHFGSVAAAVIQ